MHKVAAGDIDEDRLNHFKIMMRRDKAFSSPVGIISLDTAMDNLMTGWAPGAAKQACGASRKFDEE
jgi:hypothetical protein